MKIFLPSFSTGKFIFDGPEGRLGISSAGGEVIPNGQTAPIKVYYPAVVGVEPWEGQQRAYESDSLEFAKLQKRFPFNPMHQQLGAPHMNWALIQSRLHRGFVVPDFLLTNPTVVETVKWLRGAAGVRVVDGDCQDLQLSDLPEARPADTEPGPVGKHPAPF